MRPAKPNATTTAHFELLRVLERHPDYLQLANELRVRLGKAHYLLNAVLAKGWVKVRNFQRRDHKLRYLYLLTPRGASQRLQLTRSFMQRKELEYESLLAEMATLRNKLACVREPGLFVDTK